MPVTTLGRDASPRPALRGVCFLAPELDRVGGYELATLALARGLRTHGIPVSLVSITSDKTEPGGSPDIVRLKARAPGALLRVFPGLLVRLARRRASFSLIHCPTFGYVSGLAVLAGHLARRPTLLRVATQNDVREFADAQHWKSRLLFRLLRSAAGVIAPSRAIQDELLRAGFSPDRIFLMPNAVDVDRFRPATAFERAEAKRSLGIAADTHVVGTVARLIPRKGIDVLLRAFSVVRHTHRNTHLLVIGSGPLQQELHDLSRDLALSPSVSWLGSQAEPDTGLRAMDVFAFPSRLEGSPNAVLEAMASGLPIVATAIGGVVDLLEEQDTGVLVRSDDADALAAALVRVLGDSKLRRDLSGRARRRAVERFSLSVHIARLIDLYRVLDVSPS
jgi:glycosyltransferase involved in cell wall biosynthesis